MLLQVTVCPEQAVPGGQVVRVAIDSGAGRSGPIVVRIVVSVGGAASIVSAPEEDDAAESRMVEVLMGKAELAG